MAQVEIGTIIAALALLVAVAGGGIIGWLINGYKMHAKMITRTECTELRTTCGAVNREASRQMWEAVDEIRKDIKTMLARSGNGRRKEDADGS